MTAHEAFENLRAYRESYYSLHAAFFSGNQSLLRQSATGDMFWRRSVSRRKIHVPVAGEIAAASADLLFSEAPRFKARGAAEEQGAGAQRRLDAMARGTGLLSKLCEAAESCAALGDVYLKVNWDRDAAEYPLVGVVQADCAWPEHTGERLTALHVFTEQRPACDPGKTFRVHELYEPGRISMRAFAGNHDELGHELPAHAVRGMGFQGEMATGVRELLAAHVPNLKPNRFSRSPFFGRSDLEGNTLLMDALDEAYSSWMRDLRLGRARLIVAREYLRKMPPEYDEGARYGGAFYFDEDEEVVCSLEIDPTIGGSKGIENTQFAIRAAEHAETCRELLERIVTGAGYSPQTFGLRIEGRAESGTALRLREKKTFSTKGKKESYWRAALEGFLTALVRFDSRAYPDRGSDPEGWVSVEFADGVANDLGSLSEAALNLSRAEAASRHTLVSLLHPDWDEEEVTREVRRIARDARKEATA